jgi:hypothetical protein
MLYQILCCRELRLCAAATCAMQGAASTIITAGPSANLIANANIGDSMTFQPQNTEKYIASTSANCELRSCCLSNY